jgi:predicted branched-subunit amino acid permease
MVPSHAAPSELRAGLNAGLPFALPTLALGVSFGVLARPAMGAIAPVVMSVAIFSGGAQIAALSVLVAGGGVLAAAGAGLLVNARWLAMGVAVAPSLSHRLLTRVTQAQAIVDASFVIASREDGTFDRGLLIGATIPQASAWILGTIIGVNAGPVFGDPKTIGLDAVFVGFYLALLWAEADRREALAAAAGGAAIALALLPFAPVGVPVIAASAAALIGLRRP